jgi:hypothetical protein
LYLFKITTRSVDHERFAEGNNTFLRSRNRSLEEEEVVLDDTVVGETTQRCDLLLGDVVFRGGVVVVFAEANTIDLLVDLRSVMITICGVGVLCGWVQLRIT